MSTAGWSFIECNNELHLIQGNFSAHSPYTPVCELIRQIYELHGEQARRLLRHRIFASYEATPACLGMVKVAAKRLTDECRDEVLDRAIAQTSKTHRYDLDLSSNRENNGVCSMTPMAPMAPMTLLAPMARWPDQTIPDRFAQADEAISFVNSLSEVSLHRPIAAMVLDASGTVLGVGVNSSRFNKCEHAEILALRSAFKKSGPLKDGSQIICSRKPCKMCAGMIWHLAVNPLSIRVHFTEDDPGPKAKFTVLDTGTYERRLACARPEDVAIQIQFKSTTARQQKS